MKIARSRLVNLFVSLGCLKAEKWSNEVLEGRVASICELFELSTPIDEEYQKVFRRVHEAVKNKEEIFIVDDIEKPIVEPIQRVDKSLRLSSVETVAEGRVRNNGEDGIGGGEVADIVAEETEDSIDISENSERKSVCSSRRKLLPPAEYMSSWGTWEWMPGYEVDMFFLSGKSGTIVEIADATKRKKISVQRHLITLLRFGMVVWDEGDVFRSATREERINFIDHGIKETFKPLGAFIVRKPMFEPFD